jgi:hypothetical protein
MGDLVSTDDHGPLVPPAASPLVTPDSRALINLESASPGSASPRAFIPSSNSAHGKRTAPRVRSADRTRASGSSSTSTQRKPTPFRERNCRVSAAPGVAARPSR